MFRQAAEFGDLCNELGLQPTQIYAWLKLKDIDPDATLDDKHSGKAVRDAHRYLPNNTSLMDYSRYTSRGAD
ncbi:MAG TPA: hypothetical protein PLR25_26985 [Planctomycetaceae bacterium]|nr:hypothetical protein [Planctomycetaceae bacterium]